MTTSLSTDRSKVVIYAVQKKGAFRINNPKPYPRELHFGYVGLYENSIDPNQNWFMTKPINETPEAMTKEMAEQTISFFENNFEEFNLPFIGIFDIDNYPKNLKEFANLTGVPLIKLQQS